MSTRTPLVLSSDANGCLWRLVLFEDPPAPLLVMLEAQYKPADPEEWVRVIANAAAPEEVGLLWRKPGVLMLDEKKARPVLERLMEQHGCYPAQPFELKEPELEGHKRVSLLEFIADVESRAALATGDIWRAADPHDPHSVSVVLNAVITGAPTDPVAESLSHEDVNHIIGAQPLAVGAMVRKLREAFFLVQDMSRALGATGVAIDPAIQRRCSEFPHIQVPDVAYRLPLQHDMRDLTDLSRAELIALAQYEALREGAVVRPTTHRYLPCTAGQAQRFEPHDWVIWAMAAAIRHARMKMATNAVRQPGDSAPDDEATP